MKRAIAYYRVSTLRQGKSGLGLEAQQRSVGDFAKYNKFKIVEEFTEIETGKHDKRHVLILAFAQCKKKHAVLLIAKLDRLSRNVAFISALMESGVEFKAVDNPYAEKFTLHILAAVAQKEREDNSLRTKAALAAAKRRGVVLGKFGRNVLSKRNSKRAREFAKSMRPVIAGLKLRGFTTFRAIVTELNRLQVATYSHEGKWHLNTVYTLIKRISNTNNKRL